ncbi:MAG TPA: ABC transporter permease [Candidatus Angelobacter sp.]|nr:ABC transporter permease [Candidatus Angelobacter sp.]
MIRYLLRRLGHAIFLLFGVSLLLFFLMQLAPGDFFSTARLSGSISPASIHALRTEYGLDKPLPVRYLRWLNSVGHGDFGYSFAYNMPASALLLPRARNTLLLTVPCLLISWIIAVPLGVLAASRRGGWLDRFYSGGTSALLGMHDLLLALLALLLALRTGAFPTGGMMSLDAAGGLWANWKDVLWHMALPAIVLIVGSLAPILRHVRSTMLEVLDSHYIRAAEGHGVGRLTLLFRHALPAAANPLISLFGLSMALLIAGSMLVEVVMSWPGMGPMVLEAILARDMFLVVGAVLLSTIFLIAGNFIADILLYVFDPRIRINA